MYESEMSEFDLNMENEDEKLKEIESIKSKYIYLEKENDKNLYLLKDKIMKLEECHNIINENKILTEKLE